MKLRLLRMAEVDIFEEHGESYFRFITTPGVEPTNNPGPAHDVFPCF